MTLLWSFWNTAFRLRACVLPPRGSREPAPGTEAARSEGSTGHPAPPPPAQPEPSTGGEAKSARTEAGAEVVLRAGAPARASSPAGPQGSERRVPPRVRAPGVGAPGGAGRAVLHRHADRGVGRGGAGRPASDGDPESPSGAPRAPLTWPPSASSPHSAALPK